MFGKEKDDAAQVGSGAGNNQSGARNQAAQTGGAPSIISADMKVVGNLQSSGDVQVEGSVEGDITSRTATIGEKAHINGSINAETANIHGSITGKLNASKVRIAKTANIRGDVNYQTLSIEEGAVINGQIKRKEAGAKSEPEKKPETADTRVAPMKPLLARGGDKPTVANMKPLGGKPLVG